jgi:ketosteroid isomerase-like protein
LCILAFDEAAINLQPPPIGGLPMKGVGLSVLIFILAVSVFAEDHGDSAVESRIIAMEKAWNQAYKLRDKKALDNILDDAIVLVNDDGSLQTKAAFLSGISAAAPSEEQQVSPESISVHAFGNVAISSGVFATKGIEKGKPYVRRDRFVDTWVNKDGRWTCVAASATTVAR